MPKQVDSCVDERLSSSSFYPNLSQDERESRAWGICWNIYKKKFKDMRNRMRNSNDVIIDGLFSFNCVKNSVVETESLLSDAEARGYAMYKNIIPRKRNSVIFQAQVQSSGDFRNEETKLGWTNYYDLREDAIVNALPRIAEEPYNILYSSHRYSDEYAVGIIHKIDTATKTAICEVFRDTPQQKIVASNIVNGLTPGVSSGFAVNEVECQLCGAKGDFFPDCNHYPGREYDGKIARFWINEITYEELSTVTQPADSHSWIFRYDDQSYYDNIKGDNIISDNTPIRKTLKKNEPHKSKVTNNLHDTVEKNMSENRDETDLNTKYENLLKKVDKLLKYNTQIQNEREADKVIMKEQEKQINALANVVEDIKVNNRKELIDKILNEKLSIGLIKEVELEEERTHLSRCSVDQLNHIYSESKKFAKIMSGVNITKDVEIEHQNIGIPTSSEAVQKQSITIEELIQKRNFDNLVSILKKKSEKKPSGGKTFHPINEKILNPIHFKTVGGNS